MLPQGRSRNPNGERSERNPHLKKTVFCKHGFGHQSKEGTFGDKGDPATAVFIMATPMTVTFQ